MGPDKGESGYQGLPVVVFGASGFIGRWVARGLCAQGAQVHLVVRNVITAKPIFAGFGITGDIVELNLEDPVGVAGLIKRAAPFVTFNLAGYGVDRSETDQDTAYRINAQLVEAIAQAVSQFRKPDWSGLDLVHVGSTAEHGANGGHWPEDSPDSLPNPTTLYGRSKLAGTLALEKSSKHLGIKSLTARLFTVYGPGEHSGRLLPSLLEASRTKCPLPLTSGQQQRDFTYVGDVAAGLLRLGLARARPGQIVDLSTGRLTSVRRFVEIAAQVLDIPPENLQFGAISTAQREKEWNLAETPVSVEPLRRLIGWIPPTGIEAGIRKTQEFEIGQ